MKKTQGDRLAAHLKRKAHTYLEINMLGISVCGHKRLVEWCRTNPGWMIVKGKRDGLVTWKIVRSF